MNLNKKIVLNLALLIGCSSINAEVISIKEGWQNIGALEDLDLTIFHNSCIEYIWRYDNTDVNTPVWKLHIANGETYNYTGGSVDSVTKGSGIWIRANQSCSVDTTPVCQNVNPAYRWM